MAGRVRRTWTEIARAMRFDARIAGAAAVALALAGCGAAQAQSPSAERGQYIFDAAGCYGCHTEAGGAPMFSEAALANIIRFYGHAMQGFMGSYIEKDVQAFTDLQKQMAEQTKNFTPEMWTQFMSMQNPMALGTYAEQSRAMFEKMQEQMLGAFGIKK